MKKIISCSMGTALFTCLVFMACLCLAGEGFSEMRGWTLVVTVVMGSVFSFLIAQDLAIATSVSCTAVASVAIAATSTGSNPMGVVIAAVAIIIGASAAYEATGPKERKKFYSFLVIEALIIIAILVMVTPKGIA